MIQYYIATFAIAFLIVAATVPLVRRWALRVGFLDMPAGVKTHASPTPLGGGLAVYIGSIFAVAILIAVLGFEMPKGAVGIIAGTTLAVLIGIYDDYFHMGPLPKMAGEFIAAIIFLTFVEKIPMIISYPAYILFASIWIVGLQNAINFIDNLDGMCGGISLTIAVGFGILFLLKGMPVYALLSFGLAGGALGFLRYNLPPAKIFLGDGGSLLFGFALSCLGIVHFNTSKSMADALAPILVMAFPIFDMTLVTITRLNKGLKVYVASKDHAWDMIRVLGMTREATVNFVLLINFILVCSGIVVFLIKGSPFQTLIVVGFALILAFIGTQLYKNFLFLKYNILSILVDLLAINLSFVLYYAIKYGSNLLHYSTYVPPNQLAIPLAWINMFWIILYSAMGLYDISFERRFSAQMNVLLKSIVIAGVVFVIVNYKPGSGFQISLVSIAAFIFIMLAISVFMRWIVYRLVSKILRRRKYRVNAIIVGKGSQAGQVMENLENFNVLGYVGAEGEYPAQRLGEISELSSILGSTKTARIILDCGSSDYSDLRGIFKSSYFMETIVLAPSDYSDNLQGLKRYKSIIPGLDIISIKHRSLFTMIVFRLCNAICALTLLILMSPYFIIKALREKSKSDLSSGEAIIMDQQENELKIKKSTDSDRLKLTDLHTLLMVLKGKLGMYGVTIDTKDRYTEMTRAIPGYWRKFLVKPGIYGPGYLGADDKERFALDMKYLRNTSFTGNILMMLKQLFGKITVETYKI